MRKSKPEGIGQWFWLETTKSVVAGLSRKGFVIGYFRTFQRGWGGACTLQVRAKSGVHVGLFRWERIHAACRALFSVGTSIAGPPRSALLGAAVPPRPRPRPRPWGSPPRPPACLCWATSWPKELHPGGVVPRFPGSGLGEDSLERKMN